MKVFALFLTVVFLLLFLQTCPSLQCPSLQKYHLPLQAIEDYISNKMINIKETGVYYGGTKQCCCG